ncbi:zinc finger protein [Echinococcus multilocularis]|uniref:Zinc finger protein n=1 Tax=Echinococcus multilocularis TaxID=6211 RepID=A0A068YAP1_ECHMU|nr:zinc finger protein [Echinococcus multilocularis]
MTSAVSTMSAFQSPTEVKACPQFEGPNVSDLEQSQSSNNFLQPYQSPPFNPLVYLSYASPSTSNAQPVTINAQQTFNSTSISQNSQSKSLASFTNSDCDVVWSPISEDTPANGPSLALSADVRFPTLAISKGIATFTVQSLGSIAPSAASPSDRLPVCPPTGDSTAQELRAEFAFSVDQRQALLLPTLSEAEQLSSENRQQTTCSSTQDTESCYHGVAVAAAAAFRRNFVHVDSPTSTTNASIGAPTSAIPRPPDRWRRAHVRKQVKVEESAIPTLEGITTDQLKLVAAAVAVGGSCGNGVSPGSALDAKGRAFNFPCPACPRRFVFQCRLAAHLRSHTNFRPFTCPDCGRAFTQRGYLVRHAAVHANERPFVCALCDRAYKHYGSLVNHRRTHSKSSGAGTSTTSSKSHSRLGVSASGSSGYRCVPTMAPPAAPVLPVWASAAASAGISCHPPVMAQQQQHQPIFFRTPFSYLSTPQR